MNCALCSRVVGRYVRSDLGELICQRHRPCPRCLGYHRQPCESRVGAVQNGDRATTLARMITRDIRFLFAVQLPTVPVGVDLLTSDSLLGRCEQVSSSTGLRDARIRVRPGMDRRRFVMVYAHEATHAWLHLSARDVVDGREEGLCEYVAWRYLVAGRISADVAESMRTNPDPDYGAGLRHHIAAAGHRELRAYLQWCTVRQAGIPSVPQVPA